MTGKTKYNYVEDYLTEIQSKGRYSVTLYELMTRFNTSNKAILQNIFRLKSKNQLAQVRKGFYVIIPPQYSNRGMLPVTLFIADMMGFLNREYYVGLFSAAALNGAGHQQPMGFQVVTKKPPLRNIKNQKLDLSFFTKNKWERDQIIEKKTETGFISVSSPELTAFDLVHHNKMIGGLNRIIPILEDIIEIINPLAIGKTAKNQKTTDIQRLGYLLEELGAETIAHTLYKKIERKSLKEIPLSLSHKKRKGQINNKWKVVKNTELDF